MEVLFESTDPKGMRFVACTGTIVSLKVMNLAGAEEFGYYSSASFGIEENDGKETHFTNILIPGRLELRRDDRACFYICLANDRSSKSLLVAIGNDRGITLEKDALHRSFEKALQGFEAAMKSAKKTELFIYLGMAGLTVITLFLATPGTVGMSIYTFFSTRKTVKLLKQATAIMVEFPKRDAMIRMVEQHHLRTKPLAAAASVQSA